VQEAEAHRRADPQPSPWRGLELANGPIGVVEIGQDTRRALEIGAPGFGQAERARGPMDKTRTEIEFEVGNLPANRRFFRSARAALENDWASATATNALRAASWSIVLI
jgi:hypothetical protein